MQPRYLAAHMTATEIFESVTNGGASDFAEVVAVLNRNKPWCLIGGLAVNCYVEPVYTMDVDLVVVAMKLAEIGRTLEAQGFDVSLFEHPMNARRPASKLNIQFTTDSRYQDFLANTSQREVLGLRVPVASLENIIRGKVWACQDPNRRSGKKTNSTYCGSQRRIRDCGAYSTGNRQTIMKVVLRTLESARALACSACALAKRTLGAVCRSASFRRGRLGRNFGKCARPSVDLRNIDIGVAQADPASEPGVLAVAKVLPAVVSINTERVVRRQVHDPFEDFYAQFFGNYRVRPREIRQRYKVWGRDLLSILPVTS